MVRRRSVFWNILSQSSLTWRLIVVNTAIFFLVLIFQAYNPEIITYLALTPALLFRGHVWTLLTSMFIHASFFHLFVNMFSLFFIGSFVERIVGKKRYSWLYILSGISAGLFFAILAQFFGMGFFEKIFGNSNIAGVGASGAIFGLLGVLAVITPQARVYLIGGPLIAIVVQAILQAIFPASALFTVLSFLLTIYIFFSIFVIFSANTRMRRLAVPIQLSFWALPIIAIVPLVIVGIFVPLPIGNMAHLGGLIVGIAYGIYLRKRYRKKVDMLGRMFR